MERRDSEYFSQWVNATREEEKARQRRGATQQAQSEFKALGSGTDEDPEAWEQWYGYVDWIAEERPDDLEHARIMDSDDPNYIPAPEEEESFSE